MNGAIVVEPKLPEAQALRSWWESGGGNTTRSLSLAGTGGAGKIESLPDRLQIKHIKDRHLGTNEKPDWISFRGTFSFLKKDKEGGAWYPACANAGEPCKNRFKVNQQTDGSWFCDKCQSTYPKPVHRWIFSGTVEDDTSTTWVSVFNEQAETLFGGVTADQAYEDVNEDQDKYDSLFARAMSTEWIFKCRVKQEIVGDETRVKTNVYRMQPIDYAKESKDLLDAISKF